MAKKRIPSAELEKWQAYLTAADSLPFQQYCRNTPVESEPQGLGVGVFSYSRNPKAVGDADRKYLHHPARLPGKELDYICARYVLGRFFDPAPLITGWSRALKIGDHLLLFLEDPAYHDPAARPWLRTPAEFSAWISQFPHLALRQLDTVKNGYSYEAVLEKISGNPEATKAAPRKSRPPHRFNQLSALCRFRSGLILGEERLTLASNSVAFTRLFATGIGGQCGICCDFCGEQCGGQRGEAEGGKSPLVAGLASAQGEAAEGDICILFADEPVESCPADREIFGLSPENSAVIASYLPEVKIRWLPKSRRLAVLAEVKTDLIALYGMISHLLPNLLLRRPTHAIHAGAVAKSGKAALLLGRHQAGKSSLALELAGRDWDFLGEDIVPLRVGEDGVEAIPFRRDASLRQSSRRFLPQWEKLFAAHRPGRSFCGESFEQSDEEEQKHRFLIEEAGSKGSEPAAVRLVIQLEQIAQGKTSLSALEADEAAAALGEALSLVQGADLPAKRNLAEKIKTGLAAQAQCFRLEWTNLAEAVGLIERLMK